MSKKYNKLWVFGDSYSTPFVCVDPEDSFWGLTAKQAQIPLIKNCSRPENSFDTVSQLLIGMHQEFDWQNDLLFIGIPPLERVTIFDNYKDTEYLGHDIDTNTWQLQKFDIPCHRGLICDQNYGQDKQLIIYSDRAWTETQILRNIFLLTTWLDSKNANYMIINLSKNFDKNNIWSPSEFVLSYVAGHERCIVLENSLFDINFNVNPPADFEKYGWNGHHGPLGNKYFFEQSLLPQMQRCNLI